MRNTVVCEGNGAFVQEFCGDDEEAKVSPLRAAAGRQRQKGQPLRRQQPMWIRTRSRTTGSIVRTGVDGGLLAAKAASIDHADMVKRAKA